MTTTTERGSAAESERMPDVDQIFAEWDRSDTPGCALGIYRHGEVVYSRGYGMSNLEHGIPITPRSIFHVASISKQFTDCCIALLLTEERLSLDDDIRRYIPELPDLGATITVRHLIHHINGLRDQWALLELAGWRQHDLITDDDVLDVVKRQTALNFEPGEQFLYSNTGYTLLSIIVKRISGSSLRAFARERIFVPLGMTHTHFHDRYHEIVPGRTQAYERNDDGEWEISIPVFNVAGTTSLFTTVEDFSNWDRNFTTMEVGGPAVIDQLQTPGLLNDGTRLEYAWGLFVREHRGTKVVEHAGADSGYRAHYMRLPEHGLAVTCFANAASIAPGLLVEEVVDILIGERLHPTPDCGDWRTPRMEIEAEPALTGLEGLYRNEVGTEYARIQINDNRLASGFSKMRPLEAVGNLRFRMVDAPGVRFWFEIDPTNQCPMLFRAYGSEMPETLTRFEPPTPTAETLAGYAGDYFCPDLGTTYTLAVEDGSLYVRRRKFDDGFLLTVADDRFVGDTGKGQMIVTFVRDDDASITGFILDAGRVRNLRFVQA